MTGEAELEAKDRQHARRAGWFVEKIMRAARKGFPDRFYARGGAEVCRHCKRGRVILIEWKKDGKEPNAIQQHRHAELRAAGVEVYVCDNLEDARRIRGD